MFEESMSGKQLLNEYYSDLQEIQTRATCFDESEYVNHRLWKMRKCPLAILTQEFTSQRQNRYLGIFVYTQNGVGKSKRWDMTSYHIGLTYTSKGDRCALAFYTASGQTIKFTSHFFCRYRERYSQVCDWFMRNELKAAKTFIDIVAIYMQRNLQMTWIETKSRFRNKIHIFGPVHDGVVLLQWDKKQKVLQANTFVTEKMLNEKQAEMVEYARLYLTLPKTQQKKFHFPDFVDSDTDEKQYDDKSQ